MRSPFFQRFLLLSGLLLVCLTSIPVVALPPTSSLSQFLIRHWRQSDGLPHNSVAAITQTTDGAIWIGTHNGLVRFDGLQFEQFYKKNDEKSLRSNRVETLLRAANDGLWIGTLGGGLTQVRQGRFRSFTTKEGLPDNDILALAATPDNEKIWAGTTFGLAVWDGSEWQRFRRQDGLRSERVRALAYAPGTPEMAWVGTQSGLFVYEGGTIREAAIPLPASTVTALLPVGDSLLLVGTTRGLIRHNLNTGRQERIGNPTFHITRLYRDVAGAYWIGTRERGLHRYYRGRLETLNENNGLPDNYVRSIFEDREGGLWVGVDRGGLIRLSEGKFQNYGRREGLNPGEANCVTAGESGTVWIGTPKGLFQHKNDTFTTFLADKAIRSLAYGAAEKTLWIGTQHAGLWQLRQGQRASPVSTPEWVGKKVSAVHTRRRQHLWIAGEQGVGFWQNGTFRQVLSSADLFDTEVNALYEAQDSTLWIATNGGGIHAYRPDGTVLPFSTLDNLPSNIAFCFQEMHTPTDHFMLIGTASGLARLQDGTIEDLSLLSPILSNSIYGLTVRNEQDVWMTSNRGVIQFLFSSLSDTSSRFSYTRYDDGDGMRSSDCAFGTPPTLLQDQSGFLWVPTAKGVSRLNTHEIPLNEKPPLLVIHTLKVDGKSRDVRLLGDQELVFYSDKDRFEFYFDAFSFEAPAKIRVRYRLQGFETQWHEATGIRQATYTNLPPGEYNFQFTAANADGVWNLEEARQRLVIKPFFYETRWFDMSIVSFLLVSVYLLYYARTQGLKRQQEKLEALVEQRTEEVISQDRELRQRNDEIARVDKIAHIINQEVEFEQLFYVLLEQGVQLFEGASRGFFAVFDQETFDFELIQHYGFGTGRAPLKRIPFAPMMNYCHRGEVLPEEVYYIDNLEEMTLFNLRPAAYSVAIPIKLENTLEAMLFFEYDKPVALEGEYFRRLLRFKEHAVTAFEKSRQMKQIAEKNAALEGSFQKLSDSIQYAQRIQYAIMPSRERVERCFRDAFIMYRPRDVVSGDFYWAHKTEDKLFIAAIDCTGHGVPGAFMTVMANSIINNIVVERGLDDPAEILHAIDQKLEDIFSASTDTARRSDGMDMSFVCIDRKKQELTFAGAKSPLYYIRDEAFFRIKGSKFPIGNSDRYKHKVFVTHDLPIKENDRFYIFTDGLPDQFGGDEGGKFMTRRFRDLLLEFHHLSMREQCGILEDAFERWKGDTRQTDDVLVIGFQC